MAVAALNGLELEIPPGFEFGKTNKTPEYLAKFPLGKIPSLETPSGYYLTETNAICFYLAESGPKKEQLLGSTPEERGYVNHWVFFSCEQLYRTVITMVYPYLGYAVYDAKLEEEKLQELHRWMTYLEAHLEGKTWLLPGERAGPSFADVAVAHAFRMGFKFSIDVKDRKEYPRVMEWWNRVLSVPEIEKAFKGNILLEKKKDLSSA
jgi:elongation factor 1-gamma